MVSNYFILFYFYFYFFIIIILSYLTESGLLVDKWATPLAKTSDTFCIIVTVYVR